MIERIRIQALKSIRDLTVECSGLNLIVGTNSAGKSTFLQAILLEAQNGLDRTDLNGPLISLGDFREVRNHAMPDSNIKIWIWENKGTEPAWVEFAEDSERGYKVTASHILWDSGFHYLSCHRIGPQDIYSKYFGNDNHLGTDGEYALSYLLKHETDPVSMDLVRNRGNLANSLYEQVNDWLGYIVGTSLLLNDIKKTNYLQVRYNNNPLNANAEALYCRPINIGSGISYLITILITCLASHEKDIILIENPEIHLHPKAQSRLCEFLYLIGSSGRQLFVETHSDHIFNGLRVGISNKTMKAEDIRVDFFALDKNYMTQCNPISFGEYGKIIGMNQDMDLDDLFDQFEIDLDLMLGL